MKIMILKIALTIYSKQWTTKARFFFKNKLCCGCLKTVTKEHNTKTFLSKRSCKVCNGKHVTTLHGYLRIKTAINSDKGLTDDGKNQEGIKCVSVNTGTDVVSMCVVPINMKYSNYGKVLKTHALLDSCSQGTFILETLISNFGVKGQKTSITIKTLNGVITNKAMVVKGLRVTSGNVDSRDWLELPDTYTLKYLPVNKRDVTTTSKLKQWKHLESNVGKISQKEDISVGLLIGANCANLCNLEPIDIMLSKNDEPYAFKTKLGWCIVGPANSTSRKEVCCNQIGVRQAHANEVEKHFFQAKTLVKETEGKKMRARLYNQEYTESGSAEGKPENGMSVEDVKLMKTMKP